MAENDVTSSPSLLAWQSASESIAFASDGDRSLLRWAGPNPAAQILTIVTAAPTVSPAHHLLRRWSPLPINGEGEELTSLLMLTVP